MVPRAGILRCPGGGGSFSSRRVSLVSANVSQGEFAMKTIMLAVGAALAVCACTSTSSPQTAWGKEGVSMLDYRTDGGQCAIIAVTAPAEGNGANTAGGINGPDSARYPAQPRPQRGGLTRQRRPAPPTTVLSRRAVVGRIATTPIRTWCRAGDQQQAPGNGGAEAARRRAQVLPGQPRLHGIRAHRRAARAARDAAAGQRRAPRVSLQARHGPGRAPGSLGRAKGGS